MSVLAASNVAPPFAALVAVWSVPVPASNLLIAGIFVIAVKVIGRFVIVPQSQQPLQISLLPQCSQFLR